MITLYIFPGLWGLPSLSPFCIKSMMYMRLAGVDHTVKRGDPRKAPVGKLPYIKHPGGLLADSGNIEQWLKDNVGDPLDGALTPEQRALGHMIRRTCEESFYWTLVYSRWQDEGGWRKFEPDLKAMLPIPGFLKGIILPKLRKKAMQGLWGHGYGRHDRATVYALGVADIDAFAATLGEKPYLLGESLTSYDVMVVSFLWCVVEGPIESPLRARLTEDPRMMAYIDRVKGLYLAAEEAAAPIQQAS